MSTTEMNDLRQGLVQWIGQLTDVHVLSLLNGLREAANTSDWWTNLTEAQKEQILEGMKDADEGRTVSSAEFWRHVGNG
jgi:hypothetical protein